MTGLIGQFPIVEDVRLEILCCRDYHRDHCYSPVDWDDFITHDLDPAVLKAPTVTATRPRINGMYDCTRHRYQDGDCIKMVNTLQECAKKWTRFHLEDFEMFWLKAAVYNKLFDIPPQPQGIVTPQWPYMREMRIRACKDFKTPEVIREPWTERMENRWKHSVYAFFAAAGRAAAERPVLEEMEVQPSLVSPSSFDDPMAEDLIFKKSLCFRSGPVETQSGAQKLWIGPKATLDICGEPGEDAIETATTTTWTSSIKGTRHVPLQITWHMEECLVADKAELAGDNDGDTN